MPRGFEKRIDVLLLDVCRILVKLRLDSDPFSVVLATCNEVDTCVSLAPVVAPLVSTLHFVELRREDRIRLEEIHHQFLKRDPVFSLGLVFAELLEDFTK